MTDDDVLIIVIWLMKTQPHGNPAASAYNMSCCGRNFCIENVATANILGHVTGTYSINSILYELSTASLLIV